MPKKWLSWTAPAICMSKEGKLVCYTLLRGRALHITCLRVICHARFLCYGTALSWALCPAWASRLNSNKPSWTQAREVVAAPKGQREGWRASQAITAHSAAPPSSRRRPAELTAPPRRARSAALLSSQLTAPPRRAHDAPPPSSRRRPGMLIRTLSPTEGCII